MAEVEMLVEEVAVVSFAEPLSIITIIFIM